MMYNSNYYNSSVSSNMYQQPMMSTGYVQQPPAVNNYPIAGQPANMTQSGVPFNNIRQMLAERISAAANNDAPANQLYRESIGQTNNWMTGKMDSLVQIAAITIDYMYRQNPQSPLHEILTNAIEEVYCCSWATMCDLYPQLLSDPTMQQASKQQLVASWKEAARLRYSTFNQLGLLNNNNVAQQPVWNTPAFNNGGMPSMGVGGIPQTQTFNRGFTQPNMNNGMMYSSTNTFSAMQGMNSTVNNGFTYGNTSQRQAFSNTWGNSNNQSNTSSPQYQQQLLSTDERVAQIAEEQRRKREALGPNVKLDKYGNVINDTAPVSNEPIAYTMNSHSLEVPVGINQTPSPKPLLTSEGTGSLVEQRQTIGNGSIYDPSKVVSFAPERYPDVYENSIKPAGTKVTSGLTEVTHDIMVNAFKPKSESIKPAIAIDSSMREQFKKMRNDDGLRPDEVRYLTHEEVRQAYKNKVKFELPYLVPVDANAFTTSIHAMLTKEGKVRQEISPRGESMRPETHDILKATRDNKRIAESPNAQRTMLTTTFNGTTKGGIPYDRFAESKVVLKEGLAKAGQEEDEEKREVMIKEAFDAYTEQAKEDLENDYNGTAEWRVNNPSENEEDGEFEAAWLNDTEKEMRKKVSSGLMHMEDNPEVTYVDGLNQALMLTRMDRINEDDVRKEDSVRVNTYCTEGISHIFNHSEKCANVKNILNPLFGWKEELTDDDREILNNLSGADVATTLGSVRDALPDELWTKFNNYATEKVNEGMLNIVGLDISIDSFAEDYPQLAKYLAETVSEDEHPNIDVAYGYLDAWLLIQLRRLHNLIYNEVNDEDNINRADLRTISTVNYFRIIDVPVLPSAYGKGDMPDTIIMYDDIENNFMKKLKELLAVQLASSTNRINTKHPIHDLYVKFLDDSVYKVYSMPGARDRYNGDLEDFHGTVRLVRYKTNF